MANNPLLYNAAISGMSGGVNQRWLTNPSPVAYVPIRDQILIFAVALDAAFSADPTITTQDAALMQAICQQVFATRWPTANTLTSAAVSSLVLAIKAMFDTMRATLEVIPDGSSDTLSFEDDFFASTFPAAGSITTTGTTWATGSGNWWVQAIAGSANQTLAFGVSPTTNPNHPGIARLVTTAAANNGIGMRRGGFTGSSTQFIRGDMVDSFTVNFAIPVAANIRVQIGLDSEPVSTALTQGALLIVDTSLGNANFRITAASNGVSDSLDTGIPLVASPAATPTWWELGVEQPSLNVFDFFLNGAAVGTIDVSAAGVPVASTNIGCLVQALAASAVELQLDKYSMQSKVLNRAIN